MRGHDYRYCSKCGHEYDARQAHECYATADQVALAKSAEVAGMDEDEYMEAVIEKGEKPVKKLEVPTV